MEFVQPIRDKKKIEDMRKWLLAQTPRDQLFPSNPNLLDFVGQTS